jgi:hypothetical protein
VAANWSKASEGAQGDGGGTTGVGDIKVNLERWLLVSGGFFLLLGLLTAFISVSYHKRVMGDADLGIAILGSKPGSPERKKKEWLRSKANEAFYWGLVMTGIGIVLQTLGSFLSAK